MLNLEELTTEYPYTADGNRRWEPFTPWVDPLVAIGALGAVTERLRFFTNIYVLPMRNPFPVAKSVATASAFTGGRVSLGVGMGWCEEEFDLLDAQFRKRGARADEMLEVLEELWTGEWVEHHGEFYDFPRLEMTPAPPGEIPIYVGGLSDAALRRAARHDGWISDLISTEQAAEFRITIDRYREELGRTGDFSMIVSLNDAVTVDQFRAGPRTSASPTSSPCRGRTTAASSSRSTRRSTASSASPTTSWARSTADLRPPGPRRCRIRVRRLRMRRSLILVLMAGSLLVAACGTSGGDGAASSDGTSDATTTTAPPATVTSEDLEAILPMASDIGPDYTLEESSDDESDDEDEDDETSTTEGDEEDPTDKAFEEACPKAKELDLMDDEAEENDDEVSVEFSTPQDQGIEVALDPTPGEFDEATLDEVIEAFNDCGTVEYEDPDAGTISMTLAAEPLEGYRRLRRRRVAHGLDRAVRRPDRRRLPGLPVRGRRGGRHRDRVRRASTPTRSSPRPARPTSSPAWPPRWSPGSSP